LPIPADIFAVNGIDAHYDIMGKGAFVPTTKPFISYFELQFAIKPSK